MHPWVVIKHNIFLHGSQVFVGDWSIGTDFLSNLYAPSLFLACHKQSRILLSLSVCLSVYLSLSCCLHDIKRMVSFALVDFVMSIRLTADISHCVDLNCAGVENIRCLRLSGLCFRCWRGLTGTFAGQRIYSAWKTYDCPVRQEDCSMILCVCVCVCMHACVPAHMGVWVFACGWESGYVWVRDNRERERESGCVQTCERYMVVSVFVCVQTYVCVIDMIRFCFRNRTLFKVCMSSHVVLLVVFWRGGVMCYSCQQNVLLTFFCFDTKINT